MRANRLLRTAGRMAAALRLPVGRVLALALLLLAGVQVQAGGPFEGVASCAGSTCHGRPEGNGAVVRQDEIAQWQSPSSRSGAHSRAFAALESPRGRRIAATLGLGAATSAGACLGCHATVAPASMAGARFQLSDGVGCESCHGAAGGWLASHYAVKGTHPANVAAGMAALERPAVRAGVCLDCHLGSTRAGQFVTHQMMAAGHPRIAFELDLFSAMSQHWDEDADYRQRKGGSDHVRLWAVGQAEAVRRAAALHAVPKLASQGGFPEFTFFDCHSCHRQIDDDPARFRPFEANAARPIPYGTPPFNDESMIMLSAAGQVLAPAAGREFDAAARAFHAAIGSGQGQAAASARLAASAARLEAAFDGAAGGGDTAFAVVSTIAGKAISPRFTDYTGSVQAVMAVDTLLNSLVYQGRITVGAAAGIRGSIDRAYGAVRAPNAYDPPAFRAALGEAARAIGSLR